MEPSHSGAVAQWSRRIVDELPQDLGAVPVRGPRPLVVTRAAGRLGGGWAQRLGGGFRLPPTVFAPVAKARFLGYSVVS